MLTAREGTCRAIYSEAAPQIHSIKIAKHGLEKGDTATAFPTRSQTSPQVIRYMLVQGGIFLPSHVKKKKICRGGNTYLNFFLGKKKKKKNKIIKKDIIKRGRLQHVEQQTHLSGGWESERRRETAASAAGWQWPCPLSRQQDDNARTPLHGTAGNCSQETEVLKLENRCQRK